VFFEILWESDEDWDRWETRAHDLAKRSKKMKESFEESMHWENAAFDDRFDQRSAFEICTRAAFDLRVDFRTRTPWRPVWEPRISFPNATNKIYDEQDWGSGSFAMISYGGAKYVVRRQNFTADFQQPLSLQNFPFDIQDLSIFALCLHPPKKIRLAPHFFLPTVEVLGDGFDCVPEWSIETERHPTQGKHWEISVYRKSFTAIVFEIKGARKTGFYVTNVMLVNSILVWSSLFAFVADIENTEERLNLVCTLLLAVVAHQIVTQNYIPTINYWTWMTWFTYVNYFLLILNLIAISLSKKFLPVDGSEWPIILAWILIALLLYFILGVCAYRCIKEEAKKLEQVNADWVKADNGDTFGSITSRSNKTPNNTSFDFNFPRQSTSKFCEYARAEMNMLEKKFLPVTRMSQLTLFKV